MNGEEWVKVTTEGSFFSRSLTTYSRPNMKEIYSVIQLAPIFIGALPLKFETDKITRTCTTKFSRFKHEIEFYKPVEHRNWIKLDQYIAKYNW